MEDSTGAQDPRKRADNFDEIAKAVRDGGATVSALWVSFILFTLYAAIAVGAVTHKDLLLGSSIKLPGFSNIELPVLQFFFIAPSLFVIFHFYTLLQLAMFARTTERYNTLLEIQVPEERTDYIELRSNIREQLPNHIFTQLLSGPRSKPGSFRRGPVGRMLYLIAIITMVVFPLMIVMIFQIKFLPYQEQTVTWWHRLLFALDIALIWWLWRQVTSGAEARKVKNLAEPQNRIQPASDRTGLRYFGDYEQLLKIANLVILLILAIVFSIFLVRTPNDRLSESLVEWIDNRTEKIRSYASLVLDAVPEEKPAAGNMRSLAGLHDLLLPTEYTTIEKRGDIYGKYLSKIIIAPNEGIVETDKLNKTDIPLYLRRRNLYGAILIKADLRRIDFSFSDMRRADLSGADLRGARCEPVGPDWKCECAPSKGADLHAARLDWAQLRATKADCAVFSNAELNVAVLEEAILTGANFAGSRLIGAYLKNANLEGVNLNGADLRMATLEGARLTGATLKGAKLGYAKLPADLRGVNLQDSVWASNDISAMTCSERILLSSWLPGVYDRKRQEELRNNLLAALSPYKVIAKCRIENIAQREKRRKRISGSETGKD